MASRRPAPVKRRWPRSTSRPGLTRWLLTTYFVLLLAALLVALSSPLAFQKLNTIRLVEAHRIPVESLEGPSLTPLELFRVPPGFESDMVFEVRPAERYRSTIAAGRGNCSNRSFGAAYYLTRKGQPFQIVHMLPRETFLRGEGHTVLRVSMGEGAGARAVLLDVLAGGVVVEQGLPVDLPEIRRGADLGIHHFAVGRNDFWPRHDFHDPVAGVIRSGDVERYFDFLDRVVVPLGSRRLEKYVFDGLALLMGTLPPIYVDAASGLLDGHRLTAVRFRAAAWTLRSALLVLPILLLLLVGREVRRRATTVSGRANPRAAPAPRG